LRGLQGANSANPRTTCRATYGGEFVGGEFTYCQPAAASEPQDHATSGDQDAARAVDSVKADDDAGDSLGKPADDSANTAANDDQQHLGQFSSRADGKG